MIKTLSGQRYPSEFKDEAIQSVPERELIVFFKGGSIPSF
jgi:hypothetical protein